MSVALINVIGFTTLSAVVGLCGVVMVHNSRIEVVREPYEDESPELDMQNEMVGLGVEIIGYGSDRLTDITDSLLDTGPLRKVKSLFSRFQIQSDDKYFRVGGKSN